MDAVERWDSSLLLFLFEVQQWCRAHGAHCDLEAVPARVRTLLGQLVASHETSVPFDRSENFLTSVGLATQDAWKKVREIIAFVGECVISAWRLVRLPHKFRWRDCVDEMQQCGAMAWWQWREHGHAARVWRGGWHRVGVQRANGRHLLHA
jgi:phospholipid/cholesterol/gamma-HCH transport system permease protein